MGAPKALRGALIVAAAVAAVWGTFPAGVIAQGSPAKDRAALEALYDATDGPNGRTTRTGRPTHHWTRGTG